MPPILYLLPSWPLLMEPPPWCSSYFHHTWLSPPTAKGIQLYLNGNSASQKRLPFPPAVYATNRSHGDRPKVNQMFHSLLSGCSDKASIACLLAACSNQSGAWLNAPPISSLGQPMRNDTVRIAIGLRVGAKICQPHTCAFCGTEVDQFGHHGLSCKSSQGHSARHNSLNNIIYCSLATAKVPSRLKPTGLHCADGNHPDGITMTPWMEGRFLVWDATCVVNFCQSHRQRCAKEAGAATAHAEGEKVKTYSHLDRGYSF